MTVLACLAGPANADCGNVPSTSFKLEPDGSILEVNLFPIAADAQTISYLACPVIADEAEGEITDCHIGVTARDAEAISFGPLGACTAGDGWSADCPDFTAEGFTQNNRTALENLVAAENLACGDESRPHALASQIGRGGEASLASYRASHFEIVTDCTALEGAAQNACKALPKPAPAYLGFEAGGRITVCEMSEGNQLTACRSE